MAALDLKQTTIAVLAGGQSGEREVSLRSGSGVLQALLNRGYQAVLVDPTPELPAQLRAVGAGVVYNALHGGAGEDGCIQGILEMIGIPYTGSGVLGSALTMDKLQSKRILQAVGLPTPPYVFFRAPYTPAMTAAVIAAVGLPAVTKPNAEGSSLGVTICRDEATLAAALRECLEVYGDALVDRFIEGIELTVGVLGCGEKQRALPVLELVPHNEFYDYEAKYTKGLTDLICPARISPEATAEAQRLAVASHQALSCHGISRCDMHLDTAGGLWIHEVNSCPGMTETSDVPHEAFALGMTYEDLVEEVLQTALCPRE